MSIDEEVKRVVPRAVWSGEFSLWGVTLHCHILDNGQRIIEADDMIAFVKAMEGGGEVDENELRRFARWQKGENP